MQTEQFPLSPEALARCVAQLRAGALGILPTDTVYGIVADIRSDDAVRALYAAKGKGTASPLQLLFAPDLAEIGRFGVLNRASQSLLDAFGPGGWTIIVPAVPGWSSPALAGGATVGVRIPDAPAVHDLVGALGGPLVASSANRHGGPSPTTCVEASVQVGASCAFAIDAGPTVSQLDSTVIDCSSDEVRIVREGAIDRHQVARILGLSDIPVLRSVRL
ncbi:MAG TPA: L-threonylcarbamoyladenylate synthase [Tepidiformaceae bacterium]|nr:L-threonylcarbamoyladenylate synthase [Tepidiformaceae bacterium]